MFPFLSPCKPTISQRAGVETLQKKQKCKHRRFSVWSSLLTPPSTLLLRASLLPIPTSHQSAAGIALDILVGWKDAWEPGKGDKKKHLPSVSISSDSNILDYLVARLGPAAPALPHTLLPPSSTAGGAGSMGGFVPDNPGQELTMDRHESGAREK